jgi:tRNA-Thr(GGU) m(6)t(6)A37 methyltransferase TsaA
MSSPLILQPIGTVRGGRREPIDDHWMEVEARIELDASLFGPDALVGLHEFSHVEIVFLFDRVSSGDIVRGVRHPRGRADWPKVGIFSQRGKDRPNRIGVSVARLIEVRGTSLTVRGLDAIDGTPVIDIKPYMRGFAPRGDVVEPAWATELMRDYW